jgi:hypothetical protein
MWTGLEFLSADSIVEYLENPEIVPVNGCPFQE